MHPLDVGDAHCQVVGIPNGLNRELPDHVELHHVQVVHHLGDRHFLLRCRNEEVNFAKVISVHNVNVNDVLLERQHKS